MLHDHSPSEDELEFIDRLKEIAAFDYAPIRVTATMLEKSIIDANALVIHLLRARDVVDYDDIPKEGSVRKDIELISDAGIEKKDVNFYRPKHKADKAGDPRIWPRDSKHRLREGDLLLVGTSDGPAFMLSTAGDRDAILKHFTGFAALHGLLKKKPEAIDELMERIHQIKDVWHRSQRKGDTGIGYTFETLLGIKANSAAIPDFKGIEVKSFRARKQGKISLFSKVPDSNGHGGSKGLWEKYGYGDGDERRLYMSMYTKPNPQKWSLEIDTDAELIHARHDGVQVMQYKFSTLEASLKKKHNSTIFVSAKCKDEGDCEMFMFDKVVWCREASFQEFLQLVDENRICLDLTISIRNGGLRDHGYLWRIPEADLPKLFRTRDRLL